MGSRRRCWDETGTASCGLRRMRFLTRIMPIGRGERKRKRKSVRERGGEGETAIGTKKDHDLSDTQTDDILAGNVVDRHAAVARFDDTFHHIICQSVRWVIERFHWFGSLQD